jgi:hypothetical protein
MRGQLRILNWRGEIEKKNQIYKRIQKKNQKNKNQIWKNNKSQL